MSVPNIVLLICDDMSFDKLQGLSQFAKLGLTGVSFLKAATNTPLCQPARMSIMTGQYSHNHGVLDNDLTGYPLDHTTMLARRLQLAGYQTSHIGKYLNSWVVTDPVPTGWTDWHQLTESYYGYQVNDNSVVTTVGSAPTDYNTTVCNNRALSFIASAIQPFFMQVSYKAPHPENTAYPNITPAPEYLGVTPSSKTAPRSANFNVPMGTPPAFMSHAAMTGTDINTLDGFWRGQNETLYSVNRSIQAIKAAVPANTIIIVTADHGWMHGEGRDPGGKEVPYWQDVQIPLIVSGPSTFVVQNKVCNQLVSHVDITATIYALSGATSTRVLDGVSLTPYLTNPSSQTALRNYLLLEFLGTTGFPVTNGGSGWGVKIPTWSSVITKSYWYTSYGTGEKELYDLIHDPCQLTNLIGAPAYAAVQADLISKLNSLKNCNGTSCTI